jgi:hypothetical protein
MRPPTCLCVYSPPPPSTFECLALSLWNLVCGLYHGTWTHLNGVLYKSLPSVRVTVCVSLITLIGKRSVKCIRPFIARQRHGQHVPAATNIRDSRRIVVRVIFCAIPLLSKESLWVCRCVSLSLLGNNSIKTFPRQQSFIWNVIFCMVHVVSNERKRFLHSLPYQLTLPLAYNISALTRHSHSIFVSNCCIIMNLLPSNGSVFTEPLPRTGRCLQSHHLTTDLYTTIYMY